MAKTSHKSFASAFATMDPAKTVANANRALVLAQCHYASHADPASVLDMYAGEVNRLVRLHREELQNIAHASKQDVQPAMIELDRIYRVALDSGPVPPQL